MSNKSSFYIKALNLKPHPEGGYFREVYRSDENIPKSFLPKRYSGKRNFSTSIYFLLEGEQTSKFHRLKSDEQWHFYDGSPVRIYIIEAVGNLKSITLGNDLSKDEVFQIVIPRNNWFAAELVDKNSFCLVGCVVSPGFDFSDFEMAEREELISQFPHHKMLIERFTLQ